jgi:hypothetical protein
VGPNIAEREEEMSFLLRKIIGNRGMIFFILVAKLRDFLELFATINQG